MYAATTASSWSLMVISADRLTSVAFPIWYKLKMKKKLAWVLMVFPWVIGFLLYGPVSVMWENFHPEDSVSPGSCYSSFINDVLYNLIGIGIDFISPYFLVALFNLILYLNIRKRGKKVAGMTTNNDNRLKHDRRTAWSLALLMGVYGATWIPFVTLAVEVSLGFQISPFAIDFTSFLMIINSAVNPVIYAVMQPNFRKNFISIRNKVCICANNSVADVSPQQ